MRENLKPALTKKSEVLPLEFSYYNKQLHISLHRFVNMDSEKNTHYRIHKIIILAI